MVDKHFIQMNPMRLTGHPMEPAVRPLTFTTPQVEIQTPISQAIVCIPIIGH